LKSDAVNNLTSSSTVGKVKEEFTKRAETHLTSNNSYYNIASIKDCIDEILQLNAEKEKEIQQEIARTQYILSEQRRGILQDKSVSEITEKMETGNDYVSQFMIKQNSTYSDDIYANNADLATYKDKRTAFVNNVLSRRDKTNQLITYEYEKLSDAMKRYFKDNPEKREKETKKYEKLFHKVVEDQFKHARKKKTPVDVTRIADIVYHKITGALEI
jgi:phage/plasmid-associated DNA primase